jgi:AhpD family alkylhydroperoxidase
VTTIRLAREEDARGRLREIFNAIIRREEQLFGIRRLSNSWLAMAHRPEYLEANWERSRAIMQRGRLRPLEKELVAGGVSIVNGCRYWVDAHVAALMRMGISEVGVTELLGVVEDTQGLTRVIDALLIEPDLAREVLPESASLIGLPTGDELDEPTRAILAEIRARESELTGVDRVPNLWRALAWSSYYVKATWDKHKLVMAAGELSVRQKQIAALGVAMNASSRYLIERLTRTLLRAGQPRGDILEVAAVVDHANCMNKIADGMELPSDIVAPGHETEV